MHVMESAQTYYDCTTCYNRNQAHESPYQDLGMLVFISIPRSCPVGGARFIAPPTGRNSNRNHLMNGEGRATSTCSIQEHFVHITHQLLDFTQPTFCPLNVLQ